jgi:gamma-glutamyltranspeptidase / glutathione hydrolase
VGGAVMGRVVRARSWRWAPVLAIGSILSILMWSATPGARAAAPAPLAASSGMVVAESPAAALVGAEVLRRGGNAIDAAIAVHFALAVTYPEAGNIGGGGFMLVRLADGSSEAIGFREVAPAAATRGLFQRQDGTADGQLSTASLLASGVPGSVAGMGLAHERHGTLPWKELLAPAQRLAADGFVVDAYTAGQLLESRARLEAHPAARRIFLRDGRFWAEGDTLRQPELGATLARIAQAGPREFYEGATAESLVAEMARGGGIITREDLRAYRPVVRKPLTGAYRGYTLITMPPPSSGGIAILEMLGILGGFTLGESGPLSSRTLHLTTEAMRHAFADRAEFLGDPDFTPLPLDGLLRASYLDSLRASIDPWRATPSLQAGPGQPAGAAEFYAATGGTPGSDIYGVEPGVAPGAGSPSGVETTHFSIVDRDGNAVAVTTTLNTWYGSGLMVTGAGFLLNNEMDDFTSAPGQPNSFGLIQGEANAVRPYARPLSSMAPTIVVKDGAPLLVLGSPGGPRIISAVLQALTGVLDFGMDIQAAVAEPRIHHQWWPDVLYYEPDALTTDVREALARMGHMLTAYESIGSVQGIEVRSAEGGQRRLLGGADPRRNGCAVGVSDGRIVSRCACPPCVKAR